MRYTTRHRRPIPTRDPRAELRRAQRALQEADAAVPATTRLRSRPRFRGGARGPGALHAPRRLPRGPRAARARVLSSASLEAVTIGGPRATRSCGDSAPRIGRSFFPCSNRLLAHYPQSSSSSLAERRLRRIPPHPFTALGAGTLDSVASDCRRLSRGFSRSRPWRETAARYRLAIYFDASTLRHPQAWERVRLET